MTGKFERLLRIVNLLDRESSCKVKSLANELEVSERSIFRYMSSLQSAGFPIHFDRERGTYAFSKGFKLKKARLTIEETLAFALAKNLLGFLGKSFKQAFERLQTKILDVSAATKDIVPSVIVSGQQPHDGGDILNLIRDLALACTEHRLVKFSYESLYARKITRRDVEPYYLYFSVDGFWTLRAFCRFRKDWRTFALDRVRKWEVLDRHFLPKFLEDEIGKEVARGFDTYVDGKLEEVVVRFSPEVRGFIERKTWHPSQKNKDLDDGGLEVRFMTTAIEAVKYWLYRWIPYVQVVRPKQLREEMVEELELQMENLNSE